jgi:cytochrome c peroxidase
MAAIHLAYEAFYNGYATPTLLYYVDFADKALAEIDRIRDMTDPENRRKLRTMAETMVRSYMHDGGEYDLDEAIIHSYSADTAETHAPLLEMVEALVTPP